MRPAPGLPRRRALALTAATLLLASGCRPAAPDVAEDPRLQWHHFADRYVTAEGRVVDTAAAGVTTSIGQGHALLFAEAHGDRPAFERIHHWTRTRLGRPEGLHAWRFDPQARVPVTDPNNASLGDVMIAWALLRAGERWLEPAWRREGTRIADAILRHLVVQLDGRTLLLPAAIGFQQPDRLVLNPSHYAFPALEALSRAAPHPAWDRLITDGTVMLRAMRHGRWGLPPDWVEIGRDGHVRPASDRPARFGMEAARIPLHLAWAGMAEEPALHAAARFWNDPARLVRPAWADLGSGEVSPEAAPAGIDAVAMVATAAAARAGPPARRLPCVKDCPDTTSAALTLLCGLALREAPRRAA
jgi:endoglucanase